MAKAGTQSAGTPVLTDARWFAADVHAVDRRFHLVRIDEDVIERSAFLDSRIEASLDAAVPVHVARLAQAKLPHGPVGWLFHTSFCASTLLARALHVSPFTVALKEPLVLRRLSDARHAKTSIDGLITPTVQLLGRPWHPDGGVLIKPTHPALNLAVDLLAATPASRAIILTSSLPEFLISNLKKPPDSQAKIPLLIERALAITAFRARLTAAALQPPDPICAAGLQWAAQRELVLDIVEAVGPTRIRVMDMQPLLTDLAATVEQCARWLQLPVPADELAAHARLEGARNAKATATPYGPERRAQEAGIVVEHYRDALASAQHWLATHVLPAMRPAARTP